MRISRKGGGKVNLMLEGQSIEQVKKFKYLGVWITEDGRCGNEIKCRIGMAKERFGKMRELLTRRLSRSLKKRIIKTVIWAVLLYGSETWAMKQEEIRRLEAVEMWIWRKMEKYRTLLTYQMKL